MENVKDCPNELDELIISINLLPKHWEKFERDSGKLIKQREAEIRAASGQDKILPPTFFLNYGKKFRQLISPKLAERMNRKPEQSLENAQREICVLNDQNLALRNVSNLFQQFKEYNSPDVVFNLDNPLQKIKFNPDTTLEITGFRVIELLRAKNVPVERIRECPVCNDIFWVKRIEKSANFIPYCNNCGNTFNARRTRVRRLEKEFNSQLEKFRKLQTNLSPENKLIAEKKARVIKLREKINKRKKKYGII